MNRLERTHRRAAETREAAARQARDLGDLDRARRESDRLTIRTEAAALRREGAGRGLRQEVNSMAQGDRPVGLGGCRGLFYMTPFSALCGQ